MSESLREGLETLRDADNDKRLLGMALISLHGALEEYFRAELAPQIAAAELSGQKVDWPILVNLWAQHRTLSSRQRDEILSKNTLRNKIAHAKPYRISRPEIEAYAQFVQDFMGVHPSVYHSTFNEPPRATPTESRPEKGWSCRRQLIVGFIIILLIACWPLYSFSNSPVSPVQEEPTRMPGRGTRIFFTDEVDLADEVQEKVIGEETAVSTQPSSPPTSQAGEEQIQVTRGAANVRSGPGEDFEIVGTAPNETVYDILETSTDGNWYKIEITPGQEGWIGSSRVEKLSP